MPSVRLCESSGRAPDQINQSLVSVEAVGTACFGDSVGVQRDGPFGEVVPDGLEVRVVHESDRRAGHTEGRDGPVRGPQERGWMAAEAQRELPEVVSAVSRATTRV